MSWDLSCKYFSVRPIDKSFVISNFRKFWSEDWKIFGENGNKKIEKKMKQKSKDTEAEKTPI